MGKTFDFPLPPGSEIEYDHAGEKVQGTFIRFYEPTLKLVDKITPLKQAFFRATREVVGVATEEQKEEALEKQQSGDAKVEGSDIIVALYASQEDMTKFLLYGMELLTSKGVAKVGDDIALNKPILEQCSPELFESMLGDYMINFILASSLEKTNDS